MRRARRNVLALGADLALFQIGFAFALPSTILTAFAATLGASNVVVGTIPALLMVGWYLPSLFAAGYTQTLPRKLPFVLRYTVWERVPFLVLAASAFVVAERAPSVALAVTLLMVLVIATTGGALMPAWMDLVGQMVPLGMRGRFFATASLLGGVGGFAASLVTASVLAARPGPPGYGVCFLLAAGFMALSYVALALTREPAAAATSPPERMRAYLRRIPALLRADRNFSWFLTARALGQFGAMASGFYAVYALRALDAAAWRVGAFTTLFFAGQIAGNLALGWLADRAGHRLVIMAGVAATVGANLVALVAPSLEILGVAFVLGGFQIAAVNASYLNVLLEFAPTAGEGPTYVGVGNTLLAPFALVAPLLAGAVADALGFLAVFVLAGLFGAVALTVLATNVRDPRASAVASEP